MSVVTLWSCCVGLHLAPFGSICVRARCVDPFCVFSTPWCSGDKRRCLLFPPHHLLIHYLIRFLCPVFFFLRVVWPGSMDSGRAPQPCLSNQGRTILLAAMLDPSGRISLVGRVGGRSVLCVSVWFALSDTAAASSAVDNSN